MEIEAGDLRIKLFDDQNFTPFSADNSTQYSRQYISDDIERGFQIVSRVGVIIRDSVDSESNNKSFIICESGGATRLHKDSFLLYEDDLIICVCDKVYSINIRTLDLKWKVQVDQATCFSIHRFGDGYITHGELQLTKLNRNGRVKWEFSARDIFVTYEGEKDFYVNDGVAIVTDWSGYEYHIDQEGQLIKEIK